MDGGFAPTFKEAVGRWRRRHRHPPANETWFAVHYRAGWLVERLSTLESIHLMRQGLDVRSLSAERPARKRKETDDATDLEGEPAALESESESLDPDALEHEALEPGTLQPEAVTPSTDAG